MHVIVNEKMKIFHGHVPVRLAEGQEISGSLAAFLLERVPGKVTRTDAEGEPAPDAELDIESTAADVLAWVGEDPERAAAALAAEEAREKPRSTLMKQLQKITDQ